MMMAFLLHLASILPFSMRYDGPLLKSIKSWLRNFHNSMAALDLLMDFSSKFISHGTIQPIEVSLMGKRKRIA